MENTNERNVFMKIIDRELPAHIVYEDDETLAFLDIAPTAPGHTLVIPKKACTNVFDVDEETWQAVMRTVRKIAPAVRDAVGGKGVHINSNHGEEAGQIVPHLHMHIIPRHDRKDFTFWTPQKYTEGQAEEVAGKIKDLLK